jgi:YD repeat-containing protein
MSSAFWTGGAAFGFAQGGSTTESYAYDPVGNRTASLGVPSYTTNASNELTATSSASYGLDTAGNRTSKVDRLANVTSNYTYDGIYELTQVTQGSNTTETYSYDPVGNRLSSLGVASYGYNNSNELTSKPGVTYTYDNNGNTLTKVVGSNTTTYAWDFENRLSSVTLPASGGTVTFKYDPLGRRIYKSSSLATSVYAYDGDNLIEEVNWSGAVVARYSQGLNTDEPLAQIRSGSTSYYEADGLGLPVASRDSISSMQGARNRGRGKASPGVRPIPGGKGNNRPKLGEDFHSALGQKYCE